MSSVSSFISIYHMNFISEFLWTFNVYTYSNRTASGILGVKLLTSLYFPLWFVRWSHWAHDSHVSTSRPISLFLFCFVFPLNFPIQLPMEIALSFPIFVPFWCAYVPFHPIVFLCWTDTGHIDAMYMFIIAFHICVFECCSHLMSDTVEQMRRLSVPKLWSCTLRTCHGG